VSETGLVMKTVLVLLTGLVLETGRLLLDRGCVGDRARAITVDRIL